MSRESDAKVAAAAKGHAIHGRRQTPPSMAPPSKKPWRYYYVMAFPLSNGVRRDKLTSMLELTDAIERREEEYLRKMADRDAVARPRDPPSPLRGYMETALVALSSLALVLAVIALVWVYYASQAESELEAHAVDAAYAVAAAAAGLNGMAIAAVKTRVTTLLRIAAALLVVGVAGSAALLDEINSVLTSQDALSRAMERPRSEFTGDQVEFVLNGGAAPSLWLRFFIDGPSWFLLWLERHCTHAKLSESDESAVDSEGFFAPLWRPRGRSCAQASLRAHIRFERLLCAGLTGLLIVMATQLVLMLLLLMVDQREDVPVDSSPTKRGFKAPKRRHRHRQTQRNDSSSSSDSGISSSLLGLVRVCCAGFALTGLAIAIVSLTLLTSCDFSTPLESWTLALAALFGFVQVFLAVFVACAIRKRPVTALLVSGIALESYVASSLTEFCAAISPGVLRDSPSVAKVTLRNAFDVLFAQTCQPIKRWRRHVCVGEDSSLTAASRLPQKLQLFDSSSCADEFAELVRATAVQGVEVLSWMMIGHATVLLWLLLPSIRTFLQAMLEWICCAKHDATERSADQSLASMNTQWKHQTLSMQEARELYVKSVRGSDAALEAAVAFDAAWSAMSRTSSNVEDGSAVMFKHQFEAIVRMLVIQRMTSVCKLDVSLSLSRDGKLLYAKIFASDNLLMATLCQRSDYKLQLADAIDPGQSFWKDRREIKTDGKVLDHHTIHQKFKLLLLHGVISRKEAEMFPIETDAAVSARVHALLRIHRWRSGKLRCDNPYPAFVAYAPNTHLQYLYKKYPNRLDTATTAQQRRSAVLRTIDCLRLTRRVLDTEFDIDMMLRHGVLKGFTQLHSASRFDYVSRESLLTSWVSFWKPRHLPGEFEPQTHWILNQLGRISPFRQPLHDIRDYFGESIAFYFAWLAFYNHFLLIPSLAVVVLIGTNTLDTSSISQLFAFFHHSISSKEMDFVMSTSCVVVGVATIAWGAAFAAFWQRRSVWYQLEWGMDDLVDLGLSDRANYRGVKRRNPVTQEIEVYFPQQERLKRQFLAAVVVVCSGFFHCLACLIVLLSEGALAKWLGARGAVLAASLGLAVMILRNNDLISTVGDRLTEWENHQNERAFRRNVIYKVFAMQLFNTFGPLLLICFVVYHPIAAALPIPFVSRIVTHLTASFQEQIASHVSAIVHLQLLLLLIFATRIASHVMQIVKGLLNASLGPKQDTSTVESELKLEVYGGSYEDYTEVVVQFGLVVMFTSVFPLVPLFAFAECALEMRLDALDLCLFLQRPIPEVADGIGPWATCVRVILTLGLVVQFGMLYFMADNYSEWSIVRRTGAFLACMLLAWAATEIVWALFPSRSRQVLDVQARNAFVTRRYLGGQGDGINWSGGEAISEKLSDIERRALESTTEDEWRDGVEFHQHFEERLSLLHRLNVALRKRDETAEAELVSKLQPSPPELDVMEEARTLEESVEPSEEDRAIVGYVVRQPRQPQMLQGEEPEAHLSQPSALPSMQQGDDSGNTGVMGQYERTTLGGMDAIHVAAERERFDFAQNTGWDREGDAQRRNPRRGSLSAITRRFSLFAKKRNQDPETAQVSTAPQGSTQQFPVEIASSHTVPEPVRRPSASRDSTGALPVVQLSGLAAVHEATRRSQFDFSTDDPWRDSDGSSATV